MATMVDHWLKMFVFVLVLLNVQVHGAINALSLTILRSAVSKGAVCLDGTPPAFFHEQGSGSGANNWIVHLEGGGWCINEAECFNRSKEWRGSSSKMGHNQALGGLLTNESDTNPEFYNWNRVFIKYCDGASFSGDVEEVNPVYNITRRGSRIFRAVVQHLLKRRGMQHATNAILTGDSAGGLATMLQCDNFRKQVPRYIQVKCVADSGFFIHGKNLPGLDLREAPFASIVAYHGLDKILPKSCTSKMNATLCLFPENFVEYIQTPLFIVNSAFDQYQLDRKVEPVGPRWADCYRSINGSSASCTPPQIQAIKDFQTAFLQALPKSVCPSKGMWINNCFLHDHNIYDPRWDGSMLKVNDKTLRQAVGNWYFDRSCANDIQSGDFPYYCFI